MTENPIPTVQEIRKDGGKVRVIHSRYVLSDDKTQFIVLPTTDIVKKYKNLSSVHPKGGQTEVNISWKGQEYTGISICAWDETFNHKKGNQHAIANALGMTVPISKFEYTLIDIRKIGNQMGADMREAFRTRKTISHKSNVIDLEGLTFSQRMEVLKAYLRTVANS